MVKDKDDSLEYLFDRIFESLDRITSRLDNVEGLNDKNMKELEKEIRQARDEMRIFLVHYDILTTLSKNLSPEGLKELIEDTTQLKIFKTTILEREDERKRFKENSLKIGIPLFIFGLGVLWWLVQNFLIISPKPGG